MTRPQTAPDMNIKHDSPNKSLVDLSPIEETNEKNIVQPTKIDLQHDVQILTLTDHDNEQVPF